MNKSLPLGIAAGLAVGLSADAQHSVWTPEQGKIVITPSYVYQTFDEFWAGKDKVKLDGELWQHIAAFSIDYGITEDLTVDATIGWVWSETDSSAPGAGRQHANDNGLMDTTFGIRDRFIDENDFNRWWIPSLALRVGGIIEGTYDKNFPFSAGDGASGGEVSLLGGKRLCSYSGFYGDVGYRYRDGRVPDDWFGSAGVYFSWKFLSATVGYRFTHGLSGNDIGDPKFVQRITSGRDAFPLVREISQNFETSIGFTDPGGRFYQAFYAHTFDGRNTGERDIFGGAIGLTF
ncbi:MAG TPA: hypothetical protein VK850_13235 [Candidatus Binatia bacterium]|nr:hypothetical protein [Candidatus Binatia bacterium]